MKKWVLSKHESQETISKIEASLGISLSLPRSAQASCEEPEEGVVFVNLGEGLTFVEAGDRVFPFLGSQPALRLLPGSTVDEGAIRFLLNGADVMRPGVRAYDQWGPSGRTVVVREEKKGRAIAVGEATVASEEMASLNKGVCLRNLHHVGDRYWALHKKV